MFFLKGEQGNKGWTCWCVWTTICTTQRKPRETDTNLGVKMNEKIADVEKLGKTSREFLYYLVWKSAHFLGFCYLR